ncbi:MAG: family 2 glycosyl transferase [Bacteroidetes bacterium RBG_13_43_22]|nr:MAG: family 2 glycosyl transferase [Bacteroidetes bacterium RBG_13_43_22]
MISWYPNNKNDIRKFSIIIPTWNNLAFLKICVDSIIKNSTYNHQIIIHVNEGTDGTLEWVKKGGFDFTHSFHNIGVCWAVNACRALVKTDFIVYMNDDMYILPGWDLELVKEIEYYNNKYFFLSSTIIEPKVWPHPGTLAPYDYGTDPENFREEDLLREFSSIKGRDWSGATWPPNIVHKDIWDLIGGYSIEYFPGLYSDPDFSMKLFEAGVKHFKGVDKSRIYHFGNKSTQRIKMNNGSKQFLNKWGITSFSFTRHFLKIGQKYSGDFNLNPSIIKIGFDILRSRIKRFLWLITGTGKKKGKHSYNNFRKQ